MKLFSFSFGKKTKPYVDAGLTLTNQLVRTLNLPGWNDLQPTYRPDELEAIDQELANFQNTANSIGGGEAKFHPDAAPRLQRTLSAQALVELAGRECEWSEKPPENWKDYAATYLKAWAAQLDPMAFLKLGELLAKTGNRPEAKDTFRVVLLFSTYADTFYGGQSDPALVNDIVSSARDSLKRLG